MSVSLDLVRRQLGGQVLNEALHVICSDVFHERRQFRLSRGQYAL